MNISAVITVTLVCSEPDCPTPSKVITLSRESNSGPMGMNNLSVQPEYIANMAMDAFGWQANTSGGGDVCPIHLNPNELARLSQNLSAVSARLA